MTTLETHLLKLFESEKIDICSISGGDIMLEETENGKKIMEVSLNNIPESTIVIKMPSNLAVLKDKYSSICDYFVIVPNTESEVFFIELKKTQSESSVRRGASQIRNSIPLLHYVLSSLEVHCGYKCACKNLKKHYVVLSEGKTKQGTRPNTDLKQYIHNDYPEVFAYATEELSLQRIRLLSNKRLKSAKKPRALN